MVKHLFKPPRPSDHGLASKSYGWELVPQDVILGGTEGAIQQGPLRSRVLTTFQLKKRKDGKVVVQESVKDTMRIIKEEPYSRNTARGHGVLGCRSQNREALLILVKRNPSSATTVTTRAHSTRMSKAKATSRFRLLQGQDATNASPRRVVQVLE
ncbi:hypothetical protein Tco_0410076 [Tanacetum coccineum]